MRLRDKVAIITGGTAGIGKGIAKAFVEQGAYVVVAGTSEEKGMKTLAELGERSLFVKTDMRSEKSVKELVEKTINVYGKLDVLVNNAGYADGLGVEQQKIDEWNDLFDVNVNGYARCVRASLEYLKESQGNILNISSMVGMRGQDHAFGYCATKGAIIGMSKNLAIDLAQYGVRVNVLCPGWIITENLKENWTKIQPNPETAIEELNRMHPLKRAGTPYDCGMAATYLCSDEAAFVTGITFELEGGITLGYPNALK